MEPLQTCDSYDRCNKNVSQNALYSATVMTAEATDTTNTTIWKPKILNCNDVMKDLRG